MFESLGMREQTTLVRIVHTMIKGLFEENSALSGKLLSSELIDARNHSRHLMSLARNSHLPEKVAKTFKDPWTKVCESDQSIIATEAILKYQAELIKLMEEK